MAVKLVLFQVSKELIPFLLQEPDEGACKAQLLLPELNMTANIELMT